MGRNAFASGYAGLRKSFVVRVVQCRQWCQRNAPAQHDRVVALVERMLALHKELATVSIPADEELYQRQTWREIVERSMPPCTDRTGQCRPADRHAGLRTCTA